MPPAAPAIGIGPRIQKSPFFEATRRSGCKAYSIYNHTYFPLWYEDPLTEWRALCEAVVIWDVGCERQVEIRGPDAAAFVQHLTPRNLERFEVGRCRYAPLTDAAGGIVNDPVILKLGADRFWLSLADSDVLLWARGVAAHAGMQVEIFDPLVFPLALQGPKSATLMRDLVGDWIEELRYFHFRPFDLDGIPLIIARSGYSAQRGYELYLEDPERGDDLWERVVEAGRRYGLKPGSPSQIDRIEHGMLSYGADVTLAENPFEVGLDRFVDLTMPHDFIGKAALGRIRAAGVRRQLVGLVLEGEPLAAINEHPWPILDGAEPVGRLTSAIHSPSLAANIALGIVDIRVAEPGTKLLTSTPDGERSIQVVPLPFVGRRG